MDELIKRLEAATGPDRELDTALLQYAPDLTAGLCACTGACAPERLGYCTAVPNYTASIDAALTLVPGGWRSYSADMSVKGRARWTLEGPKTKWVVDEDGDKCAGEDWYSQGIAATPALAISTAALRARGEA